MILFFFRVLSYVYDSLFFFFSGMLLIIDEIIR